MKRSRLRRISRKREGELRKAGRPLPRSTLPAQSEKRKAVAVQRRDMVREQLAARPWCEAEPLIGGEHRCDGRSVDIHELVRRSQGGDILDPDGVLAVCRSCHDWIGRNPAEAIRLGLAKPAWERHHADG